MGTVSINTFLDIITASVWLLFGIIGALSLSNSIKKHGIRQTLINIVSFRVLGFLLIPMGLTFLSASLVFIAPQETAVVVSALAPKGYREYPLRSGLRFVVPLAERAMIYPIYWQTYTMSSNPIEGEVVGSDAIHARTKDGQVVIIDCSIIFRVDSEQVVRVHINWQSRYREDLVRARTRGLVRSLVAKYTVNEVNSIQRTNLERELNTELGEILEEEGFNMNAFVLRNIDFSPEYRASVEQKQVAEQGQEERKYEAEQIRLLAQGEAGRIQTLAEARATAIVIEAQARADARLIEADAESQALQLINIALSQNSELLTYQYINKLSPNIRAMLVPNNAPVVLPLSGSLLADPTEPLTDTLNPLPLATLEAIPETP
ncbi:MAG: hypothetical protein HC884_01415 [Chloroflexaceae bacterium]|nr:hypothetical protein [Chloroflexaceae bacterium]